jgi:hypothetical protein
MPVPRSARSTRAAARGGLRVTSDGCTTSKATLAATLRITTGGRCRPRPARRVGSVGRSAWVGLPSSARPSDEVAVGRASQDRSGRRDNDRDARHHRSGAVVFQTARRSRLRGQAAWSSRRRPFESVRAVRRLSSPRRRILLLAAPSRAPRPKTHKTAAVTTDSDSHVNATTSAVSTRVSLLSLFEMKRRTVEGRRCRVVTPTG